MPTTKQVTEDEWLPKARAAKLLGASARQLERRTAQGYIEKKVGARKPTDRNAPVLYSRADIVALKAGTPNQYAREVAAADAAVQRAAIQMNDALKATPQPAKSTALVVRNAPGANAGTPAALVAEYQIQILAKQAAGAALWLTLDEAVIYSGLPRAWLVARARDGWNAALDVSDGGTRARWRFNRDGLAGAGK